jgi:hypothetical protein
MWLDTECKIVNDPDKNERLFWKTAPEARQRLHTKTRHHTPRVIRCPRRFLSTGGTILNHHNDITVRLNRCAQESR